MERRAGNSQNPGAEQHLPKGMYDAFRGIESKKIGDARSQRTVRVEASGGKAVRLTLRVKVTGSIWDEYSLSINPGDTAQITGARKYSFGTYRDINYPSLEYLMGEILEAKKQADKKQKTGR